MRSLSPSCYRNIALLPAIVVALSSCHGDSSTNPPPDNTDATSIASVTVSPSTLTLHVGESGTLTATALSATGAVLTGKSFAWSSSNASVATVSSGTVNALAVGSATISASSGGFNATALVTVSAVVGNTQAVFAKISAGTEHTCALTAAGKAYCWGQSTYGALGTGDVVATTTPRAVATALAFTSIEASLSHTCALTATGDAYCWGRNIKGELGDGTTTQRNAPVPVSGGIKFASITTSEEGSFSCGLTGSGAAYCWGSNIGNLGDGTTTQRTTPTPVAGGLSFTTIGAGADHTCGLSAGRLYCWGQYSSIGDTGSVNRLVPFPIAPSLSFASLLVRGHGGCAMTSGNVAYCWGSIVAPGGTNTGTPTASTGQTYIALGLTDRFSCGIVSSGTMYCSGLNDFGQLGDGTVGTRTTAAPVKGSITFASVTASGWHACGLTPTGAAYCWGDNGFGEVGNGVNTQGSTWTPQPVKSP